MGYVVDANSAREFYPEAWEPDDAVLSDFEDALSREAFAVPNTYGRHYVGTVNDGEKVLRVRFFCDQKFPWHREAFGPSDGEPCNLEALYFIGSRKIAPLWYTGAGGPDLHQYDEAR